MGRVLRIDLTSQTTRVESLPLEIVRDFIGGAGVGLRLLYSEVPVGTDPLSPKNELIFAPGPLTGTGAPGSSRMAVAARSPLTGAAGVSLSGGQFPAEMKFAGFDVIVVEGKADSPTYVSILEEKVHFRDAGRVWGMSTLDSQAFIKEDLGDQNYRIACIGPAGERLSRIACIINERRAAGRKGLGAVMGAKNLKAIAVRGSQKVEVADQNRFQQARRRLLGLFKATPAVYDGLSRVGTAECIDVTCELGIFPAMNFARTGEFAPVDDLGCEIQRKDTVRRVGCHGCPVACSQVRMASAGPYAGILTEGPEFESSWAFSGATGVRYRPALYAADRLCDEYGLDTISVGMTIAFAMELFERDILGRDECDGLALRFGDHEAMLSVIRKIAFREGFGDVLADGSVAAARRIGRGSDQYLVAIKGLELPGYDVRGAKAHGLNYQTAYTGADHNRGYAAQEVFGSPIPVAVDRFAIEGKAELCKWNQDMKMALCDCSTLCAFLLTAGAILDPEAEGLGQESTHARIRTVTDMLAGATGIDFSPEDVARVGERGNTLGRAFNIREGFSRRDDYLPERLANEPISAGPSKGQRTPQEDQDKMLNRYYELCGYDQLGRPTRARLEALGLRDVADELDSMDLLGRSR
jgi:aldehyde:ferredoxin oxidoreductase